MEKIFCIVSVILVSGLVGVHSLQCYVCQNCTNPTEADLKTCSDGSSTTTTTTVSTSTTQTSTTQTSTTTANSTEGPPVNTDTTTANSTETPSLTTDATTDNSTGGPPVNNDPSSSRFKRSVLSLLTSSDSDGCSCRNEAGCKCDGHQVTNRISQYADVLYVCYKITAIVNNEDIIDRGCVPATIDGKAPCDAEDVKNMTTSCSTCDTDKCNGSYMFQFSAVLLAVTSLLVVS